MDDVQFFGSAEEGVVILWRRELLSLNYSFIGKGYVGININWIGGCYNLMNVYAPCCVMEIRILWSSLWRKRERVV